MIKFGTTTKTIQRTPDSHSPLQALFISIAEKPFRVIYFIVLNLTDLLW